MNRLKSITIISVLSLSFLLNACGLDPYNTGITEETTDRNAGNEYVYGDGADAPPRQVANTYENGSESEKRANELRAKMFPNEKRVSPEKALGEVAEESEEAAVEEETPADSTATE